MKAMLLHVELPYSIEYLRNEIEKLVGKLPFGSLPVCHTERTFSVFIPPGHVPQIVVAKIKISMNDFSNWWLIPIGGAIVSKNGSMDRLQDAVGKFLKTTDLGPGHKPNNVTFSQGRKPRGERPI